MVFIFVMVVSNILPAGAATNTSTKAVVFTNTATAAVVSYRKTNKSNFSEPTDEKIFRK